MHTTWSRQTALARRVWTAGDPERSPSRIAFGTVRHSASRIGAAASAIETASSHAGSDPMIARTVNAVSSIAITPATRWLIGRDVVVDPAVVAGDRRHGRIQAVLTTPRCRSTCTSNITIHPEHRNQETAALRSASKSIRPSASSALRCAGPYGGGAVGDWAPARSLCIPAPGRASPAAPTR